MKPFSALLALCILTFSLFAASAEVPSEKTGQPPESEAKADQSALDKAVEVAKDSSEQVLKTASETRELRGDSTYFLNANYSPIDLLIPSKYGVTLGYVMNADTTWEFEYLRGSISVPFIVEDLGEMTDERFSLIRRSYFGGNSFNLSYGLSHFDFSFHLGNKLMNRVTGGSFPSIDLIEIQSLGFNVAIGNRWALNRNVFFGVDWISWAQPVAVTNKKTPYLEYATNQQDKDDVEKATRLISYFPRFAFFKLQLGVLF